MDMLERYVAIDDKYAWPNLTHADSSIVAACGRELRVKPGEVPEQLVEQRQRCCRGHAEVALAIHILCHMYSRLSASTPTSSGFTAA